MQDTSFGQYYVLAVFDMQKKEENKEMEETGVKYIYNYTTVWTFEGQKLTFSGQ